MTRPVEAPGVAELDGLIVDLDGVVWLGDVVIPGSAEALLALEARGIRLVFLTNDPRGSGADYAERLTRLGVAVGEGAIVTSAAALAACIAESEEASTPVFAIGSPALKEELAAVGLQVCTDDSGRALGVVAVGGHEGFDYRELRIATQALRRGARLYAAGRDATFPMSDGPWPATGAVLAAVETAGGVRATVAGKPEPFIFEIARSRLGGCQRVAIVGDHLEADVAGGRRAGLTTILVLSGTTTRRDLAEARVQPDLVLPDLAALVELLPIPAGG
jgi:glycerol 3-phosphatase-2